MKNINTLVNQPTTHLAKLFQYTRELKYLNRCVQSWLPSPLNQHVSVANVKTGVLFLLVDSAAWASKVRFMTEQIKNQWRKRLSQYPVLVQIKIKVQVVHVAKPRKIKTKRALSKQSASHIQDAANVITDKKLKAALEKLASRVNR